MFRSLYILTISCSLLVMFAVSLNAADDKTAANEPGANKQEGVVDPKKTDVEHTKGEPTAQGKAGHNKEDHSAGHKDHSAGHKDHGAGHKEHIGVTDQANDDPGEISVDLMIYTGVIFLLLFLGLAKFAWGPIISAIDERETSVRNDIAAAEDGRIKAEKMLAEHAAKLESVQDEVKEIIAEARRDADQTKQDIVAAAQKEASATKDRAVADIERARDQALESVFEKMNETVAMATEHVIGHGLQAEDQNRLIDEALAQFASDHS